MKFKMKSISVKFDEDLLEQVDKYAKIYGLTRSDVIRKAVEILIKSENEKEIIPKAKVEKTKLIK